MSVQLPRCGAAPPLASAKRPPGPMEGERTPDGPRARRTNARSPFCKVTHTLCCPFLGFPSAGREEGELWGAVARLSRRPPPKLPQFLSSGRASESESESARHPHTTRAPRRPRTIALFANPREASCACSSPINQFSLSLCARAKARCVALRCVCAGERVLCASGQTRVLCDVLQG